GTELNAVRAKYWDTEYQEPDLAFLAADKRSQVLDWREKYEKMEQAIYDRAPGGLSEKDFQELQKVQEQREKEFAAILTPEEIEAYEMRHSAAAESLRAQLGGFEPTEEEFRNLFRVQKEFEKLIP